MLLRGAFSLNFYRDFMGLPATKNRPLPVGMAGFVERCIFLYLYGENSPIKSKSPRHRCVVVPSYGALLPLAGLPITVRKDHVIQIARDELIQHRTYHTPFSFPIFYIIVYASRRGFARRKLYGFHNYFSHLLSILHSAYCVLRKDSL